VEEEEDGRVDVSGLVETERGLRYRRRCCC